MGWRDKYSVHPAADAFPMMSDDELKALGEDIEKNGLRMPVIFHQSDDGDVLIDGRNRLEAMERAGIATPPHMAWITCDPVPHIISNNIHRRHLTKQEQGYLIAAALKVAEEAEADKLCQAGTVSAEPHKGGRGKVNKLKAKAIAEGKKYGIGKRTIQRSLAKAEGKKPSKRHRRTDAEIGRDVFLRWQDYLDAQNRMMEDPANPALDLLTPEQKADAIETMETYITRLRKVIDRLRQAA